jgi:hypothetical protein
MMEKALLGMAEEIPIGTKETSHLGTEAKHQEQVADGCKHEADEGCDRAFVSRACARKGINLYAQSWLDNTLHY